MAFHGAAPAVVMAVAVLSPAQVAAAAAFTEAKANYQHACREVTAAMDKVKQADLQSLEHPRHIQSVLDWNKKLRNARAKAGRLTASTGYALVPRRIDTNAARRAARHVAAAAVEARNTARRAMNAAAREVARLA